MKLSSALYTSLLLLCFLTPCFSQEPQKALQQYCAKKDTVYKWQTAGVLANKTGSFYEVTLVSQQWHNITWSHRLIIHFPEKAAHSNTLLLVLRHIYDKDAGLASLKIISDSTGTAAAILYDIPNQPLFGGKEEDDLQAYTFSQYINTGDETWPLLFPMVKSVVAAMNAVQELAAKEKKPPVNKFIVAGHSKKGHTSWLAAAVDHRIKGVIPIAIDVLNSPAQLPHHLEVFGAYSAPTQEATDFLKELKKPLGNNLIQMIDPYSYKAYLTLPKLIVCATNDELFPTDALNLYWDGLKGAKSVLYLSNAGHVSADSDPRINPAAFAFVRAVAADKTLPVFSWDYKLSKQNVQLTIHTDTAARKAVVWQATSKSKDFRTSQWSASSTKPVSKGNARQFTAELKKSSGANKMIYAEIEFEQDGHRFLLSTQTFGYR